MSDFKEYKNKENLSIPPQSSTLENPIEDETGALILDGNTEDKLLNQIIKDYGIADGGRRSWLAKKDVGLRLFWGILPVKDFPFKNCANVNVPMLRTLTETLHSNLQGSFDIRHPFDVIPVGAEDIVKAARVRKFINWQFSNEINFNDLLDRILHFSLIYGHAVVKCRYVQESRKRKTYAPNENGGMQIKDEILFDGVRVDVLNPEDFLFPINVLTADVDNPNMSYIIHEIPMTTSEIRRRIASRQYKDIELGPPKYSGSYDYSQQSLKYTRDIHLGTNRTENPIGNLYEYRFHRILEWYGWYDIDNDGIEENIMATVAFDQRKLLRAIVWDMPRPFKIIRFSPVFNTPFGESVPDLLGKLNEELNTLHNQRVDAVTLTNVPFGFYDPLSGFDPDEIQLVPGLMLPTNGDPRLAVYFPNPNTVKPEYYREEELLLSYGERLVGAGANVQGAINPRRISATEVSTIDRRAGIRFFTIFQRIKQGLEDVARLVLELDQRFMPAEKQVRVMGMADYPVFSNLVSFENFKREEIQGKFDIIANAESIADEDANKQEQLQIYQIALSNPLISSDPESLYEVTKDTLMALGAKNLGAYLKRPQISVPQNPDDEHNKLAQGQEIDPVQGENYDRHLLEHAKWINSPQFKLVPSEGQIEAMKHYDKTIKLKQIQEQLMQIQQAQMQLQQHQALNQQNALAEQEHQRNLELKDAGKSRGIETSKSINKNG